MAIPSDLWPTIVVVVVQHAEHDRGLVDCLAFYVTPPLAEVPITWIDIPMLKELGTSQDERETR